MTIALMNLTYEIEIAPGEKLVLPQSLLDSISAGRWVVSFKPAAPASMRSHAAFLNSFAPEDEGLYDDLVAVQS